MLVLPKQRVSHSWDYSSCIGLLSALKLLKQFKKSLTGRLLIPIIRVQKKILMILNPLKPPNPKPPKRQIKKINLKLRMSPMVLVFRSARSICHLLRRFQFNARNFNPMCQSRPIKSFKLYYWKFSNESSTMKTYLISSKEMHWMKTYRLATPDKL